MRIDHVALEASDIAATVQWYTRQFGAEVLYQDPSWALIRIGASKLAFVTPGQHPAHIAFAVTEEELEQRSASEGKAIEAHRDGTRGVYLQDPQGNSVELICYPPNYLGNVEASAATGHMPWRPGV